MTGLASKVEDTQKSQNGDAERLHLLTRETVTRMDKVEADFRKPEQRLKKVESSFETLAQKELSLETTLGHLQKNVEEIGKKVKKF